MAIYAQIQRTSGGPVGTQTFGQMSILIYDAATNLPTNGNYCVVAYQQNINGTVNNYQVTIPGLSSPIYTGLLSDSNPSSYFFTNFQVISLTPGTPVTNPATDDLVLSSIVTTPESALGAADGTVKIIASSSFPAIQYSLDNITWQSSPLFSGRTSGAGTGYAKDANGGFLSKPYTVNFTGNVLTSDPTVDLGNGNLSRWNAAFNPIFFKFQRKDFLITSITPGALGNIKVAVNADLTPVTARTTTGSITSPGDFVYIKTTLYEGTYEVLIKDITGLTLNCPYTANDTTGFININSIKAYYQIQIKITYVDPVTNKFITITTNFNPFSNGYVRADLSFLLQSLLQAKDKSDYSLINYRDMQLSASYTIQYAEIWTGGIVSWTNIARPYYVIYAAKQLGEKSAVSLQEYVPYPLGFQPAKWITDFKMPVFNPGFPFDIGFIFSEYMVGLAPFYNVTLLDINKNPLTNQTIGNAFLLNQDGGFLLNQDGSKFIIASQALVNQPIVQNVGLNRLLINFNIPDLCWYFKIQIQYTAAGTTYNLTQPITLRVDQNTTDRPVYLRWIGLNGSWNYYKFVYNQVVSLDVSEAVTMKRYVVDWANEDTIEDVISKNAGEKMQVFAENMSVDDIKGLQSIKYSPKVQLLKQSGPPPKWVTVNVASGTFTERETFIDEYSFSLTFALPSKNIQNQ